MKRDSQIGIIGYGATAYEKKTSRSLFSFLSEAGRCAVECAGLQFADIDGLAISSFELPPDNTVTTARAVWSVAQLGLSGHSRQRRPRRQ
jgi:hypothetical protein